MSTAFSKISVNTEDLLFRGFFWVIPFSCSASCDSPLSLSSMAGPFLIAPATKSYFISQNRSRRLWNQRAGVTLPHHTSPSTTYNHVLNIPVLKGVFGDTGTECLARQATSCHILVSFQLAGSSASFVSAISPGFLRTPNLLTLLFRKCQLSRTSS